MKEKYTENVVTNAINAKVCASVIKDLRKYSKNNVISTEDMLKNRIKITNINKNAAFKTNKKMSCIQLYDIFSAFNNTQIYSQFTRD